MSPACSFEYSPHILAWGCSIASPLKKPAKLQPTDSITAVLVRAQPGQNLQTLKRRLELALPGTRAFTKAEFSQFTQTYWLNSTGVTFILGMEAVVAIIVGTIVVSQALWMSMLGYFPGIGLCSALGTWTAQTQSIQILITPQIAMGVLGLTLGMGAPSAVIALQKVTTLYAALVFQP